MRNRGTITLQLVLASTLVALLLAEFLVRRFDPQALVVPWQDEIDGITAPRPGVAGRHLVPGVFDVRISYSAQRFRGNRSYDERPSDGVLRVAALGDSFTFGYGAEDHTAYPAQLERFLEAQFSDSNEFQRAEVINAGNGGTGTGEQALWFDIWVKRFNPHFVAVGITSNDLDDDIRRGLFYQDAEGRVRPKNFQETAAADSVLRKVRNFVNDLPGYGSLSQRSHLLALMRNVVSHRLAAGRAARVTESIGSSPPGEGSPGFWSRVTSILEGEIAWLNRQVVKNGARLIVVFIPSRESVYATDSPWKTTIQHRSELIRDALQRVCNAENIVFSDLTGKIRLAAESSPESLYYSGLDTHPTPEGYAVIASSISAVLAREL